MSIILSAALSAKFLTFRLLIVITTLVESPLSSVTTSNAFESSKSSKISSSISFSSLRFFTYNAPPTAAPVTAAVPNNFFKNPISKPPIIILNIFVLVVTNFL